MKRAMIILSALAIMAMTAVSVETSYIETDYQEPKFILVEDGMIFVSDYRLDFQERNKFSMR